MQIHLVTIIPAFLLGTWLLFASRKGSPRHRSIGKIYLALMAASATTAIFVQELNPGHFTWVHAFVLLTYFGVFSALWSVRRKDIAAHKRSMIGLYLGGLLIAGSLTFAPGRLMHRIFFE